MKKKIAALLVGTMVLTVMAGCGKDTGTTATTQIAETAITETAETNDDKAEESAEEAESSQEEETGITGMGNPWVDITEDEARSLVTRLFKAPEGAENIGWLKCEELGDPDNSISPLVQLDFTLDDMIFTARVQQGAAEDTDIAGLYVEWTVGPEDTTLANWGEGHMPGKTYRSINESGMIDLITWYDMEIGISYALSTASDDLDGFDIQAIAEQMYDGENEPFADIPLNFIEEQSGKTEFKDYDEVISCLTEGQGYAYITLKGYEGDVLAVTDLVFEADHSAAEASLFMMEDGAAKYVGDVTGNGSAYPLRLEDGIIYCGDNHNYYTHFAASAYTGIMVKDTVADDISTEGSGFIGTLRESNDYDNDQDFTGGQEEFDKLISEREQKPIIEFTAI